MGKIRESRSPQGEGGERGAIAKRELGEGLQTIDNPKPLTPTLSLWERERAEFAARASTEEGLRPICPITGRQCEGDLSHLCEDYGCARKGGLSPHSHENF
jgi:hypothetical protein